MDVQKLWKCFAHDFSVPIFQIQDCGLKFNGCCHVFC